MSNIKAITQAFGPISTRFQGVDLQDDMSSGVSAGFGLIGYRGKVWSVRYRGDEEALMRDDGDGPRNSIEVVVVKASPVISKIWYADGWVEGSNSPPDCFSNNGVVPEPSSAKLQNPVCATCPRNQWGSRITPAGKQAKDCNDAKRLAILPLEDLENEAYGGPMLLRVPAASLQDMAQYAMKMNHMGYPSYAIGTRISFDAAESYPKFVFNAIRPLTDDEADIVIAMRDSPLVDNILADATEYAAPVQSPAALETAFEQPPVTPSVTSQGNQQTPQQANTASQPQEGGPQGQQAPASKGGSRKPKTPAQTPSQPQGKATPQQDTQQAAQPAAQPTQKKGGFGKTSPVGHVGTVTNTSQNAGANGTSQQEVVQQEVVQQEVNEEASGELFSEGVGEEVEEGGEEQGALDFESKLDKLLSGLL